MFSKKKNRTGQRIQRVGAIALLASLLFTAFELLSKIAGVVEAWQFMEQRFPILSQLPDIVLPIAGIIVSILISIYIVSLILKRYRRRLILPLVVNRPFCRFKGDARLQFREARDPMDIEALAKTEEYGTAGSTNLQQVTEWWSKYPNGNMLALYDGKVIGGIDIWPITKTAHDKFIKREMSEEQLMAKDIISNPMDKCRHWYVGSVSLDMVWRGPRIRAELLIRLFIETIEMWRKTANVFPANIIAEAWTTEGRALLVKHMEFRYASTKDYRTEQSAVYCRTLKSPEELDQILARLKKLVERGP